MKNATSLVKGRWHFIGRLARCQSVRQSGSNTYSPSSQRRISATQA